MIIVRYPDRSANHDMYRLNAIMPYFINCDTGVEPRLDTQRTGDKNTSRTMALMKRMKAARRLVIKTRRDAMRAARLEETLARLEDGRTRIGDGELRR